MDSGDAKAGKDKVNEAYYKHYEIVPACIGHESHLRFARSQVEMVPRSSRRPTPTTIRRRRTSTATLTNYIREDANSRRLHRQGRSGFKHSRGFPA